MELFVAYNSHYNVELNEAVIKSIPVFTKRLAGDTKKCQIDMRQFRGALLEFYIFAKL